MQSFLVVRGGRLVVVSWVLLSIASCCCPSVYRVYEGAALGRNEVAVVEAVQSDMGIRKVDGERVISHGGVPVRAVEVLPGDHVVEVRWYVPSTAVSSGYRTDVELPLRAVAGGSYMIYSFRGAAGPGFWIKEAATGRLVSGVAPH